jgi:hypothetical protein
MRRWLPATALVLAVATVPASAEDFCKATGVMGGKAYTMTHCAISFYESENSVTIWWNEAPPSPEEKSTFEVSSYAPEKDAKGTRRTQIHMGFCPGGGKPVPSPAAVRSVELGMSHADSPWLSRQWVFELPADKDLKFEKLTGELKPGGRLAGKATGGKTSDDKQYSWKLEFDLTLPAKTASGGQGCGS